MAKQTKQQRIDELETAIGEIYKKARYGLLAQVKRKDRDAASVGTTAGENIIELCTLACPNLGSNTK